MGLCCLGSSEVKESSPQKSQKIQPLQLEHAPRPAASTTPKRDSQLPYTTSNKSTASWNSSGSSAQNHTGGSSLPLEARPGKVSTGSLRDQSRPPSNSDSHKKIPATIPASTFLSSLDRSRIEDIPLQTRQPETVTNGKFTVRPSIVPEIPASPWTAKNHSDAQNGSEAQEGQLRSEAFKPATSDSAASIGKPTPSVDLIDFPLRLGREGRQLPTFNTFRAASQDLFTAEQEEQEASKLAAPLRSRPGLPEEDTAGNRVALKDVKLKHRDGEPILLGEGGYGRVYHGSVHKEDCAVKIVLGGNRKEQARFLKEIKILERLYSNHITRYMGYSICPDGLILLMEYLDGGTLLAALALDPSDYQYYKRGKKAMLSVAIALNHLHSKNIAHLDIKSPNILLTSHGEAKVADVGLSTMIQQGMSIVSRTSTFAWSAPEQLHGHAGKPADIWAFGTVLWEVCTCERPPRDRCLRPIEVPEEAPQQIVDLIDRCHAPEWKDRPDCVELHTLLEDCPW